MESSEEDNIICGHTKNSSQRGSWHLGKSFNYRLSRARRIIENTFGIAAARFRVFRCPIHARVEMVVNITKVVVALHNYLMNGKTFESRSNYCPARFTDSWHTVGGRMAECC